MADLSTKIDTAVAATKFIGDLATSAVTVGNVAVTVVELLAPWIPGLGPIMTDIQVALPIIRQVAAYAPQVSAAIQNNKSAIEAMAGVGEALFMPLSNLEAKFPGIVVAGVLVDAFLKANQFTPQDARFDRGSEH